MCLQQFAPIYAARAFLRDRHQIGIRSARLDADRCRVPRWVANADVIVIQCNHFMTRASGLRFIEEVRNLAPSRPLLYFDGDDDAGVSWPEAIRHCDLYVKNQLYRDRSWYLKRFIGKSNLTHHVAENHGISLPDDPFPCSEPLAAVDLPKLTLGWNLGCSDPVRKFMATARPAKHRSIDVVFRGNVPPDWLAPLRTIPRQPLEATMRRWHVSVDASRRPWEEYVQELCSAKACISPFGYGEVCFRDFEAVLAGAVLIKPDMSHLETRPDIYRPWETYAPVKWDWSDLPEVVDRVLGDPEAGCVLASRARTVLEEFLDQHTVAKVFVHLLSGKDEGTQHHTP